MDLLLFRAALIGYLLATAGHLVYILTLRKDAARVANGVLVGGFLFHTASLAVRWSEAGYPPITNPHEAFSFFSWALVWAYGLLYFRFRLPVLGAFVIPIVTVFMILSSLAPAEILPLPPALKSLWLPVHAFISLLGHAFMALAFASAVMYLLQEREIKKKKLGAIFKRLPSLDTLDAINYWSLKIGFPFMTLGIITGSLWAEKAWGAYWSWDPKETWSLITWFLYAALLHERLAVGWRGRRAAILSVVGFMALIFTFLGVNFLLGGEHSYGRWPG